MIALQSNNIAMVLEYDGTHFHGFQKQPNNVRTIQSELEFALSKFTNEPINICVSGRTDAGVHALYQVINFKTTAQREIASFVYGVNAILPPDIVIHEACLVEPSFNARFSARVRTYNYYLLITKIRPALFANKIAYCYDDLEIVKMQLAANYLIGKKDFSSFRASGCQAQSAVRHMFTANIAQQENLICFTFSADAFLYHMVRNIVGALVYVGRSKLTVLDFAELINACKRTLAPPTFSACGLYLSKVAYEQQLFSYKSKLLTLSQCN